MKDVRQAFVETMNVIFGECPGRLEDYENWLTRYVPKGKISKSSRDSKKIYLPTYGIFRQIPEEKIAGVESLDELSKKHMNLQGSENLKTIKSKLDSISTPVVEFEEGENSGIEDSTIFFNLFQAYRVIDIWHGKYLAFCFWSDNCQSCFGLSKSFNCQFSINCHNSRLINRSFEVDFCKNCSDVMFCHNCENVKDSLFCFNTKNKKYAVGNVEIGKEKYLEIRKKLVEYILEKLRTKRSLEVDIYNIGLRSVKAKTG